ncbi:hypothetical protein [Microvirga lenta]|uniref:hypothetical protein n=1 Tax=Microvirga lenta TaxID=2881337 RepID=UPI001D0001F9|nr:hypothetical protein [Microvirga lenta]MCB5176293.1 hypothetical protein [Microvirga lenta]
MQLPLPEQIKQQAAEVAFGKPLIVNNLRALVAELIVDCALRPEWRWCSGDWAGWDFEHADGTRLEVKQSAARQSWSTRPKRPQSPRFDIEARSGHWVEGGNWQQNETAGRLANLYVFAFHPVSDDTADHRDPSQWIFHVTPSDLLPNNKTITLSRVRSLAEPVGYADLLASVERVRRARSGFETPVSGSA